MKYFLFGISILTFLLGLLLLKVAQSSIHEIEAGVLLMISAVTLGSGAIVLELEKLRKKPII